MDTTTTDHAADIDRHVRVYITVFASLMVLTIVTVGVSRFHFPVPVAVTLALRHRPRGFLPRPTRSLLLLALQS